uniref:Uncharacterized protein n=1 Tax=Haptolina brevifila TaxID=156173 RepID=A0A7S2INC0_9EUKA|mmetsp:Transcript_68881/g.136542  ORF Transcript_68881/g.136542 Transcript_68881/m.136542 type:complete len:260 (+) Transcript_68881:56-835(+)
MDMEPTNSVAARELLMKALPATEQQTYWEALRKFLRFELPKTEFDRVAIEALGAHIALHNNLILALLKDAQRGEPPELAFEPAEAMEVDDFAPAAPMAQDATPKLCGGMEAASSSVAPLPTQESSAPKLTVKIKADGSGNLAVSSVQGPQVEVDVREEEQINALHDRLFEIAQQQGLQAVQPEAVSFMARAIRAATNRLIVAAVLGAAERGTGALEGDKRSVSAEDLSDAIRQPAPAPWMAPPSQRVGYTLGVFGKFVP